MHEHEPILGVMHILLPSLQHDDKKCLREMGNELAVPIATIIRARPPSDHLVGNAICFLANIVSYCGDVVPSVCTQQLFQSLLSVVQCNELTASLAKQNIPFLLSALLEYTSPTSNTGMKDQTQFCWSVVVVVVVADWLLFQPSLVVVFRIASTAS
jgi:hypothetical protein